MRHKIVPVKNVARLSTAGDALINRTLGMPGMGLIWGQTGAGKTSAATWFVNQVYGVYVRAMATWSPSSMLAAILRELDVEPRGNCAQMTELVVSKLAESGRPLFVDEADYVVENKRMVETLRDLHDMSTVPVILIGMAGIQRTIAGRQQLAGRIAQWVEFGPCDRQDARLLADHLCEIQVADDLLDKLFTSTGGSARLLVVGLSRIEQAARARGIDTMGAADWRQGDDFHLGATPERPRAGRLARRSVA